MIKKYFKISEVAEALGLQYQTVWRWVKTGKLKAVRTHTGRLLIPVEEVRRILGDKIESHCTGCI